MARPSMAALIDHVRRNIGDVGDVKVFTDDEIEAALDRRRQDRQYWRLTTTPTYEPSGAVSWKDFYSETGGDWEDSVTLTDATYTVATPSSSNLVSGRWTFDPGLQVDAIYVSGTQYDTNGASADLLEQWMARVKTEYSFSRGNRSFQRSQQIQAFESAIDMFRSRQWITVTEMVRADTLPGGRYGF